MVSLVIQTVLLMAIAFILGALIGCLLRRLFGGAEQAPAKVEEKPVIQPVAREATPQKEPVVPKPPIPAAPVEPKEKPVVAKTPVAPVVSQPAAKPTGKPDNLKLIKGIGPQNEGRLNALGITHFEQIANWSPKDEAHYGETLAFPGRIEREEWVKQAKVLAKGETTSFSKRVKSGDVESSQGAADAGGGTKPSGLLSAPRDGVADGLTAIGGVGAAIEKKLNTIGVFHFDQIAKMTSAELDWLGASVGFPGRPERENWAGEAQDLAAGNAAPAKKSTRGQIKAKKK